MNPPLRLHHYAAMGSLLLANLCATSQLAAQGTAFTYQGRLENSGAPVSGTYDLRFALYDASTSGAPQGSTLTNAATAVSNGLFTVSLDFGNQYPGADRWLEIGVRTNGGGSFTVLNPRQKLTSTPYAYRASQAGSATTATSASVASSVSSGVILNSSLAANAVTADKISDGTIGLADLSATLSGSTFWRLDGNAGTTGGTHFLGTTDNQPLEIKVNGQTAFRLQPKTGVLPSVIGGFQNGVSLMTAGGGNTIGGGSTNYISDGNSHHNTIAGGNQNGISDSDLATIGGGRSNHIFVASSAVIGGGYGNYIQDGAACTIGGGSLNRMPYSGTYYGTIGGGQYNLIYPGSYGTVPGGLSNTASGFSFAAGRRAKAVYQGDFVWADSTDADFQATGANQFLVRASGGVGINTNQPTAALHIGGTPGVDGIRFPDGSLQTTAAPAPTVLFTSGSGNNPATTNNFLSTTIAVAVTGPSQKILVTAHKAFGSTSPAGANGLNLYIGYRLLSSTGGPTAVGAGIFGNQVAQNTRVTMGLSGVISGLAAGTYAVGLVGLSSDAANWNYNEYSYVTAVVY